MAYRFQSKFRILARHENRSVSVFRKCSSQELPPKSPIVVPRITIKGNNSFGNKTTRPSPKVAACIMLQGKPNNFQDSEEEKILTLSEYYFSRVSKQVGRRVARG